MEHSLKSGSRIYIQNENELKIIKGTIFLFLAGIISIAIFKHDKTVETIGTEYLVMKKGLIFLECDTIPFTGKIIDTLDNKMIVQINIVKGLINGEYLIFNINSRLAASGYMANNKSNGNWKYYYENGQLQCEGKYNNDEPTGKWTWYYENGFKKCEGVYTNGALQGKWIRYDEQGCPIFVFNFQYGELLSFVEINKLVMI